MKIEKVKQQKNSYLVNDSMSVPIDEQNVDYQKVQKWISLGGVVQEFDFLEYVKAEKISQIKNTASSLILATYPIHKQLNILMSQDNAIINEMNLFISLIRVKSNELEAGLEELSAEEIKNYPIQFIS